MAVGVIISGNGGDDQSAEYSGKITWFVLLSSIVAATGGLLFGYDTGITGGVTSMEDFLRKFFPSVYKEMSEDTNISNYCKFNSQLLTAFTSSLYVAGLVASFVAAPVTKNFGRKVSILIGGLAFFAGAVLGGVSYNIYMLILGRLLLGVGIGFSNQAIPLYLSEIAPYKYRGAFNTGFQICVGTGTLVSSIVNYGTQKIIGGWGWRLSLALAVVPASILTTGSMFLPETPSSLIQHGKDSQKVKKLLQRIRGTDDVGKELEDLIAAGEKTIKNPLKTILLRKYRPQLVMALAIPLFQQLTGINMVVFYAPILFRTIGVGESASLLCAVVIGLVGMSTTILSLFIVDKVGRRILFQIGGTQMLITQVIIGGIMETKLNDHGGLSKTFSIAVLALICLYVAGFGLSWGPLGWLVPSEIFPLEIRSAAQSINVAVGFLTTFVVAQTFLAMLCAFKSALFFFFGGWVVLMTVFVFVLLPETKDVPLEKMDRIWREHWFWHKYVDEIEDDEYVEEEGVDDLVFVGNQHNGPNWYAPDGHRAS